MIYHPNSYPFWYSLIRYFVIDIWLFDKKKINTSSIWFSSSSLDTLCLWLNKLSKVYSLAGLRFERMTNAVSKTYQLQYSYSDTLGSGMSFCVDRKRRIRVPCTVHYSWIKSSYWIRTRKLCQKSSTPHWTLIKALVCPNNLLLPPGNPCSECLQHRKQRCIKP